MTKNKEVFVSFISPCYNVNKYLPEFLESFNTLLEINFNFEIIVIDDRGAEDPTSIIEKYSKTLPIKYIKNKMNLGLGFSRNVGLKNLDKNSTHVMYVDSDDVLSHNKFVKDIEIGKITWFYALYFDKVKSWHKNRVDSIGKNLFTNSACGVVIPSNIAIKFLFETRSYEDLLVNRRLVAKYKDEIKLSHEESFGYRCRASGLSKSNPTAEKFSDFMKNIQTLIDEDINTYRFNIQEVHQYYWMWRKYLKKDIKAKDLIKTKWYYKTLFFITGNLVRFLGLETLVSGRGRKNDYE